MSKVVVISNVTLDGVMQAPGRSDEDTRGGFEHGGWARVRGDDPDIGRAMGERMAQSGALLLGRRTYEDFYGFWPHQKDNPFTEVLVNVRKYVASKDAGGATAVEQFHAARWRCRRGRGPAQGSAGQGSRDPRQR